MLTGFILPYTLKYYKTFILFFSDEEKRQGARPAKIRYHSFCSEISEISPALNPADIRYFSTASLLSGYPV